MGQLYSTLFPYECTAERYETDNIIITSNHMTMGGTYSGTQGRVEDLIFPGGQAKVENGRGTEFHITYEFKNNIKVLPKMIHFMAGGDDDRTVQVKLYCIDSSTNEEVQLLTQVAPKTGEINASADYYGFDVTIDTDIMTSKLIARITAPAVWVSHLSYDFEIDQTSQMIKNKVEHVIMQNTLFQKVISNAEIIED